MAGRVRKQHRRGWRVVRELVENIIEAFLRARALPSNHLNSDNTSTTALVAVKRRPRRPSSQREPGREAAQLPRDVQLRSDECPGPHTGARSTIPGAARIVVLCALSEIAGSGLCVDIGAFLHIRRTNHPTCAAATMRYFSSERGLESTILLHEAVLKMPKRAVSTMRMALAPMRNLLNPTVCSFFHSDCLRPSEHFP